MNRRSMVNSLAAVVLAPLGLRIAHEPAVAPEGCCSCLSAGEGMIRARPGWRTEEEAAAIAREKHEMIFGRQA
jgi:hypothetical protein